ncbi:MULTISPECIES: hypothetical protein [Glycomyces]|uniref:Uncharacterized protein n=1 Tax=Glycomyces artemisiae TaxID=1076443 RepID=A0A2T0USB3_9ACTN|nr:hypothetical protein [Glycomyces artemisiae]NUQ90039.1 hypothetical protein [Glycomyces artemisiae]PRY60829.1 hypothetical protein B0I28_102441 [Glycomyces artemisiae]
MSDRSVDPDALAEFREAAQGRLDFLETLIERLRHGNELGVEPGFGLLDSGQTAREMYRDFHRQTWSNLQDLRSDLAGIIATVDGVAERAADTDANSAADLSRSED